MLILYVFLSVYILAVNFYAFLLVKTLRDKERAEMAEREFSPVATENTQPPKTTDKSFAKLLLTGALGGAITIYICMFLLKYKRGELLLMVLMPLLGVLNIYVFVLLFKSGFGFLLIR